MQQYSVYMQFTMRKKIFRLQANEKSFAAERFSVVLRTIFQSQHNDFKLSAVNNIYLPKASSHSEKHPFTTV